MCMFSGSLPNSILVESTFLLFFSSLRIFVLKRERRAGDPHSDWVWVCFPLKRVLLEQILQHLLRNIAKRKFAVMI